MRIYALDIGALSRQFAYVSLQSNRSIFFFFSILLVFFSFDRRSSVVARRPSVPCGCAILLCVYTLVCVCVCVCTAPVSPANENDGVEMLTISLGRIKYLDDVIVCCIEETGRNMPKWETTFRIDVVAERNRFGTLVIVFSHFSPWIPFRWRRCKVARWLSSSANSHVIGGGFICLIIAMAMINEQRRKSKQEHPEMTFTPFGRYSAQCRRHKSRLPKLCNST